MECPFIKAAFHRSGFSSSGFFIESTISSSFQNCKQNVCSTSTSKVIDDFVGVTLSNPSLTTHLSGASPACQEPPMVECLFIEAAFHQKLL